MTVVGHGCSSFHFEAVGTGKRGILVRGLHGMYVALRKIKILMIF